LGPYIQERICDDGSRRITDDLFHIQPTAMAFDSGDCESERGTKDKKGPAEGGGQDRVFLKGGAKNDQGGRERASTRFGRKKRPVWRDSVGEGL